MLLEIAAILTDIGIAVAGWAGKAPDRRNNKASQRALSKLQPLEGLQIAEPDADELAELLPDGLHASVAQPMIETREFYVTTTELFVAVVAGSNDLYLDKIKLSLRIQARDLLVPEVDLSVAELFADNISQWIILKVDALLLELEASNPELLISLQNAARGTRSISILESIEGHLASKMAANHKEVLAEDLAWEERYRISFDRFHGFIQPPDFDRNRYVAIDDIYVSPYFIESDGPGPELTFADMRANIDRTVILGDPGGGKTTFSNALGYSYSRQPTAQTVPFIVTLRNFAQESSTSSILEYIEKQTSTQYQCQSPAGSIERLLRNGKTIVIFDGLDELIDTTRRREITRIVDVFSMQYPAAKILVTSRRVGYEQAMLDDAVFSSFQIGGFREADINEYVSKWFSSQDDYIRRDPAALADSFISQSTAVPDLRKNPLMLALMCIIFQGENYIPRNRPAIYKKCAELLFEKWDGHRLIEVPLRARKYVDSAMKHLAFWMLTSGQAEVGVRRTDLVREITSFLTPRAYSDRDESARAAEEFVDFCKGRAWVFTDTGTTASGDPLFMFTHRTFMEYFAANNLVKTSSSPKALAAALLPQVAQGNWDVVGQLAVQLVEDAHDRGSELVLEAMLNDKRKRTRAKRNGVLTFITRCMEFATISQAFTERATEVALRSVVGLPNVWVSGLPVSTSAPWNSVLVTSGANFQFVSETYRRVICTMLREDDRTRDGAIGIVLSHSSQLHTNGFSDQNRSTPLSRQWAALARELGIQHLELFMNESRSNPPLIVAMVKGGILSLVNGTEMLAAHGISPGEVLFGYEHDGRTPIFPQSISESITMGACSYPGIDVPEFYEEILRDFSSLSKQVIDLQPLTMRAPLRFDGILIVKGPMFSNPAYQSEEARVAVTLAVLGTWEIALSQEYALDFGDVMSEGAFRSILEARRTGERELPESVFEELDLPPMVCEFLQSWITGRARVLHISPNNQRADLMLLQEDELTA